MYHEPMMYSSYRLGRIVYESVARTSLHKRTMAEQRLLPSTPSRSYRMAAHYIASDQPVG